MCVSAVVRAALPHSADHSQSKTNPEICLCHSIQVNSATRNPAQSTTGRPTTTRGTKSFSCGCRAWDCDSPCKRLKVLPGFGFRLKPMPKQNEHILELQVEAPLLSMLAVKSVADASSCENARRFVVRKSRKEQDPVSGAILNCLASSHECPFLGRGGGGYRIVFRRRSS